MLCNNIIINIILIVLIMIKKMEELCKEHTIIRLCTCFLFKSAAICPSRYFQISFISSGSILIPSRDLPRRCSMFLFSNVNFINYRRSLHILWVYFACILSHYSHWVRFLVSKFFRNAWKSHLPCCNRNKIKLRRTRCRLDYIIGNNDSQESN